MNEPQERKNLAYNALDDFEKLKSRKKIEHKELETIVEAATCPYVMVWDIGTTLLMALSSKHECAREAAYKIVCSSKKAKHRVQIVAGLDNNMPREYCVRIVRTALNDRGSNIRGAAAIASDRFFLKELIPDLEGRLKIEKNKYTRNAIRYHLGMLRDGYFYEKSESGEHRLTLRSEDGWRTPNLNKYDIDRDGVKSVVEQILRDDEISKAKQ